MEQFCSKTSVKHQVLKAYIVYTSNAKTDEAFALSLCTSLLQNVADGDTAPKSVIQHYKQSFSGFVVKLTEEEAERMAGFVLKVSDISLNALV
ncbi:cucumisin-like [Senna tora]|uniref:Cucumisin-like n=1 Tax=Senna tora TaxID=362788 RepID=A0A834SQL4_9FABA|nr:cucumisin-like [Senna tora]